MEELATGRRSSTPLRAALIIYPIIVELDNCLMKGATARKNIGILLDDNEGGITNILVFIDDLNPVVAH